MDGSNLYTYFDKNLNKIVTITTTTSDVDPDKISSGSVVSSLAQQVGSIYNGKTGFNNNSTGYMLGVDTSDGLAKFYLGNTTDYLNWNGTDFILSGSISASTINIGGSDATSFHVDVDGNMWLGAAAFANGVFKVTNAGAMTASSVIITGGVYTGTFKNSSGDVIMNTSNQTILKDFTFSPDDYSGAFKTGDITWNISTGAITGGSGGLFNKNGLIFAHNGVATITLDGATGNATFAGILDAASGTIGTINLSAGGYIKGGQTAFKTGDGVFLGYDTTPELDQWATPTTDYDDPFANGTTSKLGCYFNLSSSTSTIKKVSFKLRVASGTSGDITCDIYLANSSFLPTGNSLGSVTIPGIANTAYEVKDFIFSTPVSVTGTSAYVAVLSSTTTSPAILMCANQYWSPDGNGMKSAYYTDAWHTDGSTPYIRVYSYNAGYKFSTGNSTYSLSYNGANLQSVGTMQVRGSVSDSYTDYTSSGVGIYQKGLKLMYLEYSGGLQLRDIDATTRSLKDVYGITRLDGSAYGYSASRGLKISSGADTQGTIAVWAMDNNAMRIDPYPASHTLVIGGMTYVEIGSSSHKARVYCSGLSACPLPTVDSALDKMNAIPEPKVKEELNDPALAHFEFEKDKTKTLKKGEVAPQRKYFDITDVPEELTCLNDKGEKDIELIRVIGFLFEAVKELNNKVNKLEI